MLKIRNLLILAKFAFVQSIAVFVQSTAPVQKFKFWDKMWGVQSIAVLVQSIASVKILKNCSVDLDCPGSGSILLPVKEGMNLGVSWIIINQFWKLLIRWIWNCLQTNFDFVQMKFIRAAGLLFLVFLSILPLKMLVKEKKIKQRNIFLNFN